MDSRTARDFWERLLDAQEETTEALTHGGTKVTFMLGALVVITFANLILRLIGLL